MEWSIIGHERQKRTFEAVLRNDSFVHAYLFAGPAMVGKRSFAADIVRAAHTSGADPYRTDIAPNERGVIAIEAIRELRRSLTLQAPPTVRRFVLIDDADTMTREAANAFLKSLEEPPARVSFILVTSMPGRLPDTIRSRCHAVRFDVLRDDDIRSFVGKDASIATRDRDDIVRLAAGRPGWIAGNIERERLQNALDDGRSLETHLQGGVTERMMWAKDVSSREDIRQLVVEWIAAARGAVHGRSVGPAVLHGLLELNEALRTTGVTARLALEDFMLRYGGVDEKSRPVGVGS